MVDIYRRPIGVDEPCREGKDSVGTDIAVDGVELYCADRLEVVRAETGRCDFCCLLASAGSPTTWQWTKTSAHLSHALGGIE